MHRQSSLAASPITWTPSAAGPVAHELPQRVAPRPWLRSLIGEERPGLIPRALSGGASAAAVQAGSWRAGGPESRSAALKLGQRVHVHVDQGDGKFITAPCTVSWVATRSS
jgi:hypothetical protein